MKKVFANVQQLFIQSCFAISATISKRVLLIKMLLFEMRCLTLYSIYCEFLLLGYTSSFCLFLGFFVVFLSVHNKLPNIMTSISKQQYTAAKFKMDTQEHLTVH